ncbi:MAG: phosphoenolpyruvate synthase [Candidatus Omnitrophica bacterium]|nr:phosphoenolpyruvate synthase [Candidatus Omnitrophota bacterium]
MGRVSFCGKAETLERLAPLLKNAKVLPQLRFTLESWRSNPESVWKKVISTGWGRAPLIVRSSAFTEDGAGSSEAGQYLSVPAVLGRTALEKAVSRVVASFADRNPAHQIFLQPYLKAVVLSGVVFSRDPSTGGPYFIINYDDVSNSTSSVTSGRSRLHKTVYVYRDAWDRCCPARMRKIVSLVCEVEHLLGSDAVDVEFAVGRDGHLYLLQVRPLTVPAVPAAQPSQQEQALEAIHKKIQRSVRPHPYLFGSRTVYGIMPDWNPAEIIGVRPRPLAFSLYKELITDNIWAYQRDNYGYRNLRSFPLLLSFCGLPYIDVRVSFNSFIPADIEVSLARRLVDYYIKRLVENPHHHDKVEFDIIYSCYTPDLPARLKSLKKEGFSDTDLKKFSESLRRLTNGIVHEKRGLWRGDIGKIKELESRRLVIQASSLDTVSKIYWLLEDCKRYGTLPFAGLARAAFIAIQLLRSLENIGVFSRADYASFMASLNTVSSRLTRDLFHLSKAEFLRHYGHLRPGSYDILSPRYDETPDRYFDWSQKKRPNKIQARPFRLNSKQSKQIEILLGEHGLDHSVESFFYFIRQAIEGREYAKFIFSRSLSDALVLFKGLSEKCGFSREESSYADMECVGRLYSSSLEASQVLGASIEEGRRRYALTTSISLPPLIVDANEVWAFEIASCEPNFVTLGSAEGPVSSEKEDKQRLKGSVLFLPSADPGYDWIFSRSIAGFITMYGGANSHMAIRAVEMGVPAVIGAGEALYSNWSRAKRVRLDCAKRQVTVLA